MAEEYKGFYIVGDQSFSMKLIKRKGTGALPQMLQGSFTTPYEAMKAIDHAVSEKGEKNAEANTTS